MNMLNQLLVSLHYTNGFLLPILPSIVWWSPSNAVHIDVDLQLLAVLPGLTLSALVFCSLLRNHPSLLRGFILIITIFRRVLLMSSSLLFLLGCRVVLVVMTLCRGGRVVYVLIVWVHLVVLVLLSLVQLLTGLGWVLLGGLGQLASLGWFQGTDNQVLVSRGGVVRLCDLLMCRPRAFDAFLNGCGKAIFIRWGREWGSLRLFSRLYDLPAARDLCGVRVMLGIGLLA